MLRNNRGSASVLFIVVVVPFLLIMLVIGIEVSQFLGLREEMQRLMDSEAKVSLGRSHDPEYLSRRMASRAESLKPYVSLVNVRSHQTPQQGTLVVEGAYQGLLTQLVSSITRGDDLAIPFRLSTTVRRSHTTALILLDRVVGVGSDRCGDENLTRRAQFVARLAEDLRAFGVGSVRVGVFPGVDGEIDTLSTADTVPRCGGSNDMSPLRIASVEGVDGGSSFDSLTVAYRAVQLLFSLGSDTATEHRTIVMVAPPFDARTEAVTTTFSLLETEAARQKVNVSAVGIAVGGPDGKDLFEVRSASGRAKYLHLSENEVAGSDARIALVHHLQGQTFVAR